MLTSLRPTRVFSLCSRRLATLALAGTLLACSGMMCDTSLLPLPGFMQPTEPTAQSDDPAVNALLLPAPKLPIGFYDYFGDLKSPAQARIMVVDAGLDPDIPDHYLRLGLIHITDQLIAEGRHIFDTQTLGDPFTIGNILSISSYFGKSLIEAGLDSISPDKDPDGSLSFLRDMFASILIRPKVATTNLQVLITRDLVLGTTRFPAGTWINTGADIAAGELMPVGFKGGTVSCSLCHSSVDMDTGREIPGIPNTDLNMAFFIALSPNSAGVFLKLNKADFDPRDPKWPKTGKSILNSDGNTIQLADPKAFEAAVDDYLLTIPRGLFDAGPDFTSAMTRIPDSFIFGEGGASWDGGFLVGPFGGAASFASAVHSFEVNLLSPAKFSDVTAGLDPEIYLGTVLQNAGDPALHFPDGVRPTQWLAENFPGAEASVFVRLEHSPNPSLFTLNGLVFSPPGQRFLQTPIALAAFQSSLTVPPNKTMDNRRAIESGAVARGAAIFLQAKCGECHTAPFFTNRQISSNDLVKANAARGKTRLFVNGLLADAVLPAFDQMVPLPPNPALITLPPNEFAADNLHLPPGLDTAAGGYKVTGLLGTYLKAPYLHDGGIAVGPDAIKVGNDGSYTIADASELGATNTTRVSKPVSAAHSLRALLDRNLRALVVANNHADPALVRSNVEGIGHEFFVDPAAGFSYQQQTDLIGFLLCLDDHPAQF